jgi:TRAP-type transport system small permease protein
MEKLNELLKKLELMVGSFLLCVIFVNILANVMMRYFFRLPILWSEELSNFAFVWLGFFALSYVQANDSHIRFTLIYQRMSERNKRKSRILMNAVLIVVLGSLIVPGIEALPYLHPTPAFRVHAGLFHLVAPLSYAILIVHCCVHVLCDMRFLRQSEPHESEK